MFVNPCPLQVTMLLALPTVLIPRLPWPLWVTGDTGFSRTSKADHVRKWSKWSCFYSLSFCMRYFGYNSFVLVSFVNVVLLWSSCWGPVLFLAYVTRALREPDKIWGSLVLNSFVTTKMQETCNDLYFWKKANQQSRNPCELLVGVTSSDY